MSSTTGSAHLEVRGLLISPHRACTKRRHESLCAMMLSCLSSNDLHSPTAECNLSVYIPNPLDLKPDDILLLVFVFF